MGVLDENIEIAVEHDVKVGSKIVDQGSSQGLASVNDSGGELICRVLIHAVTEPETKTHWVIHSHRIQLEEEEE